MNKPDKGQVSQSAAQVYEEFYLPALFQQWPPTIIEKAGIQTGQRVLDVACGTGVLARAVDQQVGPSGSVIGVDVNEDMLAVAAGQAPHIQWQSGQAENLPFDDDSFDAVVSQFGLMFFNDRRAAIREMLRVLRSGGRCVVAVWDELDRTPGYARMVDLLQRLFGDDVANGLRMPFCLGNQDELRSLFHSAGLSDFEITTVEGVAQFPSLDSWVYTDVNGWVMDDMIDDDQFEILLHEAQETLTAFVLDDGQIRFDAPAHLVSVQKP